MERYSKNHVWNNSRNTLMTNNDSALFFVKLPLYMMYLLHERQFGVSKCLWNNV